MSARKWLGAELALNHPEECADAGLVTDMFRGLKHLEILRGVAKREKGRRQRRLYRILPSASGFAEDLYPRHTRESDTQP
jgi:hypothetical protein